MFTGIIEEIGAIAALKRGSSSARLTIRAPLVSEGTRPGDSVAINGTCLTVVEIDGPHLHFDAVLETLRRSSLKSARVGEAVNLERALAVGGRLGGHFVQGHVDGTGTLRSVSPAENARVLKIGAPADLMRYIVSKGSVALDGISLTVVDVFADAFTVWIIPHTWTHTVLQYRRVGDPLNIETDILARYVERLLGRAGENHPLTLDRLAASGFLSE
jgi:riboflavin synthase